MGKLAGEWKDGRMEKWESAHSNLPTFQFSSHPCPHTGSFFVGFAKLSCCSAIVSYWRGSRRIELREPVPPTNGPPNIGADSTAPALTAVSGNSAGNPASGKSFR